MWYCIFFATTLVGVVQAGAGGYTSSNCCLPVKTISVSLADLIKGSPFYTLESSCTTAVGVDISLVDSICFTFYSDDGYYVKDDCFLYSQGIFTLTNGSVVGLPNIHTTTSRGQFLMNATTTSLQVSFIGRVCLNVYVAYLCPLSQGEPFVIIISNSRSVDPKCLLKAEEIACETFPGIQFTTLPNTASYPCLCDSQSLCA